MDAVTKRPAVVETDDGFVIGEAGSAIIGCRSSDHRAFDGVLPGIVSAGAANRFSNRVIGKPTWGDAAARRAPKYGEK